MSNAIFAWMNAVKTGALAASSAVPTLPVTNLQIDQGDTSASWQTLAGVTAAYFTVTTLADPGWNILGLFRSNLTPAATVRWRIGAYDSGAIGGVVAGYGQHVVVPAGASGTVARCDISDPTNPDGFINVALAYAGPAWQPGVGVSFATTFGRDVQTDETTSRGGQEFPVTRWRRRRWAVDMQGITAAETWASADVLDGAARGGGNVLFAPDSQSATLQQEAIFGRLTPAADFGFPAQDGNARSWKATITERL